MDQSRDAVASSSSDRPPAGAGANADCWTVLVVDDDADVHASTAYTLEDLEIEGRPLRLLHAGRANEALALLRREPDVAVILLDVVMETDDAGLLLVDAVRGELGMQRVRIIVRTGQPGRAPLAETIRHYDINGYRNKSEDSRASLHSALTFAVRSYAQMLRTGQHQMPLQDIVAGSRILIATTSVAAFGDEVLALLPQVTGVPAAGLVCVGAKTESGQAAPAPVVVAASDALAPLRGHSLTTLGDARLQERLQLLLAAREHRMDAGGISLYIAAEADGAMLVHLDLAMAAQHASRHMLDSFAHTVALCASNQRQLQRLRRQALVDPLLGLPNRTAFIAHLDAVRHRTDLAGQAICLLDVDEFSDSNDVFGYAHGDALLAAVAARLRAALALEAPAGHAMLARAGDDSFAVRGATEIVNPRALRQLLRAPFEVLGVPRQVSFSFGFVAFDNPATPGADYFKNAAIALKRAKMQWRDQSDHYTAEAGAAARSRMHTLQALHRGVPDDALSLAYQPQVALADRRTVALEALLRWRGVDGTAVAPDQFIPLAERSGLIVPIGNWVLRTALRDCAALHAHGHALRMAVNVSARQLMHPEFLDTLDAALADNAVAPGYLELEITESVAVTGMESAMALMAQIKARGVALAIDDFGTGFSALSYLYQLPVDRLKIDRSLVRAMETGSAGAQVAATVVPLGQRLGLRVLAEGVETLAQEQMLRAAGCDEAQGLLYAPPMALDALLAWLDTGAASVQARR